MGPAADANASRRSGRAPLAGVGFMEALRKGWAVHESPEIMDTLSGVWGKMYGRRNCPGDGQKRTVIRGTVYGAALSHSGNGPVARHNRLVCGGTGQEAGHESPFVRQWGQNVRALRPSFRMCH